jgi:Protein of unknown function (DUF2971)
MDPLHELKALSSSVYTEKPTRTLFHYTSIEGLMGIVDAKALWASEVRYLNDAQELYHFGSLANQQILQAQGTNSDTEGLEILRQFGEWLKERLSSGPLVFVSSLTENGNLLSQWRGYCPHGKGVSLGFNPHKLVEAADTKAFSLGRCIYDSKKQSEIVTEVISIILRGAKALGRAPPNVRHPTQSYYSVFKDLDGDILRIASLLKHPAFSEESEWRAVSPAFSNYVSAPICYRDGKTMLVPFIRLTLPTHDGRLDVPEIVVGPTPTPNLSLNSIAQYLSKNASHSQHQVSACLIPYRQ